MTYTEKENRSRPAGRPSGRCKVDPLRVMCKDPQSASVEFHFGIFRRVGRYHTIHGAFYVALDLTWPPQ